MPPERQIAGGHVPTAIRSRLAAGVRVRRPDLLPHRFVLRDLGLARDEPLSSSLIEPVMGLTNPWRLALLFFISGVAVRFAVDKTTLSEFLPERITRLVVPLAFGMAVICAPRSRGGPRRSPVRPRSARCGGSGTALGRSGSRTRSSPAPWPVRRRRARTGCRSVRPSQNVPKSGCSLVDDPMLATHAAERVCTGVGGHVGVPCVGGREGPDTLRSASWCGWRSVRWA